MYLKTLAGFLVFLSHHLFIRVDARLSFCMTGFRRHANPLELALQCLLSFAFRLLFAAETFLFLFEPRRVISSPRNSLSAIEFENPTGDVVEEVAIVCDGDDRPGVVLQVMFEPRD